ncbi:MAG: hypothetical protein PVF42_04805 [Desulfobacterales bacterium]
MNAVVHYDHVSYRFVRDQYVIRTYLKNNLSAHGGVVKWFKMLTYCVYAPLFHRSTFPILGISQSSTCYS